MEDGPHMGSCITQKLQLQVVMGVRDHERQQGSGNGNVGLKEDDSPPTKSSCK